MEGRNKSVTKTRFIVSRKWKENSRKFYLDTQNVYLKLNKRFSSFRKYVSNDGNNIVNIDIYFPECFIEFSFQTLCTFHWQMFAISLCHSCKAAVCNLSLKYFAILSIQPITVFTAECLFLEKHRSEYKRRVCPVCSHFGIRNRDRWPPDADSFYLKIQLSPSNVLSWIASSTPDPKHHL